MAQSVKFCCSVSRRPECSSPAQVWKVRHGVTPLSSQHREVGTGRSLELAGQPASQRSVSVRDPASKIR